MKNFYIVRKNHEILFAFKQRMTELLYFDDNFYFNEKKTLFCRFLARKFNFSIMYYLKFCNEKMIRILIGNISPTNEEH